MPETLNLMTPDEQVDQAPDAGVMDGSEAVDDGEVLAADTAKKSKSRGFFTFWRKNNSPVQVDAVRREDEQRKSMLQIRQGYNEVVDTMQAVRSHLDEQANRSDRMLELLEHLPAALKSMPEAQRDQSRALEAIREHLDHQNNVTDQLTAAISGLTHAAGAQRETIQTLHEGMRHEATTREEVRDSLKTLDSTLGNVSDSSEASRALLVDVAEDAKLREEATREMMRKSQRTSVVLTVLALSIAALAVGVAVWLAVTVTQSLQSGVTP